MNKALFLDRDGTLIEDTHYLHNPNDVRLLPKVIEALSIAQKKGYFLFLFTNQSGIGRGYYNMEDAIACNEEMIRQLGIGQIPFTDICIAPEAPEQPQEYRKPSPKFINEMVSAHGLNKDLCWMIGDRLSDLEAGIQAKINSAYLSTGKPKSAQTNDFISSHSIPEFDRLIDLTNSIP